MQKEITTREAVDLVNGITAAQGRIRGAKVSLGLRLAYNAKALLPIAQAYEQSRAELIQKHAKRGEDGEVISEGEGIARRILIADVEAFNAETNELLDETFAVELKTIDVGLLPDAVDPYVIAGLFAIITEE
jgi:hypothetical protein